MRIRFTPRAVQDLFDIAEYIRKRNPTAALRVRAAILESLQHLAMFPRVGRRQNVEAVRKLLTRRYPYLVYYMVDESAGEIIILAVRHPARKRDHEDV